METSTSVQTNSSMEALLEERAQQLFLLSDKERKGFIVKRDMQRMRSEIPLTPEQLEAVFDSLDVNNNGYLTIEQFLSGFGEFIASQSNNSWETDDLMEAPQKDIEDEESMEYLLKELESLNMLHNVEVLRQLCRRVGRESKPQIQDNLESFLQQLVMDLKRHQEEHRSLEEAFKLKDSEHEVQVHRLFEEMEAQLHEEKKSQTHQEQQQKMRSRQSSLEQDLFEKEQQLQDALNRQQELADRIHMLRSKENNIREENECLLRAKEELEIQLEAEHQEVVQLQHFLEDARQNEAWERRKHLSSGFRLAKKIMLEQQGLIKQLQLLQEMTSTLEGNKEEEEKIATNIMSSERKFQEVNGELKSLPVSPTEIKRQLSHFDSEDDFFEGTELLMCPNCENDENRC